MKKYIFLDFDGVLNTERNIQALREQGKPVYDRFGYIFDERAVTNLAKIIDQTGAMLVITSSWKIAGLETMVAMWASRNLPGLVTDITPLTVWQPEQLNYDHPDDYIGRGKEIRQWLSLHGEKEYNYVILDDVDDFLQSQHPFFLQTDPYIGITAEDAEKAIEILNRSDNKTITNPLT